MDQPKLKWFNAGKGVRYWEHPTRKFKGKPDRNYYIRFKVDGKLVSEKLGWASEGMNLTKALIEREKLRLNHRLGQGPVSLREKRELAGEKRKAKTEEEDRQRREALTFGEFMEKHYLPWAKVNKTHWKDDLNRFKVHLTESLGDKPLKGITSFMLEGVKKRLQEKGLAPATVKHCLAIIRQAYNKAVLWGLYDGANPVKGVKIPRLDNAKMRVLTPEEESLLLGALKKRSRQTHDMAAVSLYSGLRFGEIAAMKWQDINFEHSIINVKGKGGRPRKVPLHDRLKEILEVRRSTDASPSDLIFPDRKGSQQERISALFYRVIEELGLNAGRERKYRLDFHSLRHSFGTRLAQIAPITDVRDVLGHANLIMTSRYSHGSADRAMAAVQSLGQEDQDR
jgi:integrase